MNKAPLKQLLDSENLLPEEREMWLDAGFYVPTANNGGVPMIYRYDGISEALGIKTARLIREAVIERWLSTRKEKVRIVEVDSFLDSIEERSK